MGFRWASQTALRRARAAQDVRWTLSDPSGNLSLLVSGAELAELLEVTFANYNGAPHDGLGGCSPIEAMQHFAQKAKRNSARSPAQQLWPERRADDRRQQHSE
jgi:hypothetical protein